MNYFSMKLVEGGSLAEGVARGEGRVKKTRRRQQSWWRQLLGRSIMPINAGLLRRATEAGRRVGEKRWVARRGTMLPTPGL
jgi:hypothetical protein